MKTILFLGTVERFAQRDINRRLYVYTAWQRFCWDTSGSGRASYKYLHGVYTCDRRPARLHTLERPGARALVASVIHGSSRVCSSISPPFTYQRSILRASSLVALHLLSLASAFYNFNVRGSVYSRKKASFSRQSAIYLATISHQPSLPAQFSHARIRLRSRVVPRDLGQHLGYAANVPAPYGSRALRFPRGFP